MTGFQNDPGTIQQEAGFGFTGRFWTESFNNIVARAGGGRASATKIDSMYITVTTVATVGDSVVLPPIAILPGGALVICVSNAAVNAMQVFSDGTDTINGVAGATGVPQMGQSVVYYQATSNGAWLVEGLGSGYSSSFPTVSTVDGLVARAGGGQALGTPITTATALFSTVVTGGDSATLPPAKPGMQITVVNKTAATSMNVFPVTGETINALSANTALAVAGATVTLFYCGTAGAWWTK